MISEKMGLKIGNKRESTEFRNFSNHVYIVSRVAEFSEEFEL